jgi:thiol-disulfide isomerase/thioredoxin
VRYLLVLAIVAPLAAEVIPEVRYKISAGDLTSADAIADAYCQTSGANSECADALSWLARGALIMQEPERTRFYLERTKAMTSELLRKTRVEDDSYLATAIGATIEVQARLLVSQGKTGQAVALLQSELPKWKLWAIEARIRKNLNLLSLEGRPAPALPAGNSGHVILLFLWGHWCSDCTAQAPVIERIKRRYELQGLHILAPTRRIGSTGDNDHATPEQEDSEIELVWKRSYGGLTDVPHPVDEKLMLTYGVSSTPTLVLVDRTGTVRMYSPYRMSESVLASRIEPLLK